ncbi:tetratricopeptide repeat protein [Chitinibacter sp. FCG-7]|uniref:Tetratricopeptide repeat protein n=1 Tax=Chitinibacter mangrovi TaxID=3153927 RepID=A0AAU7FCY1_9NEIS
MSVDERLILELETIARESHCGSPPSPFVALELLKSAHGNVRAMALASVILGHAWQHISEHHKAQMAFSTAIAEFRKVPAPHDETEAMILLGTSHLLSGEPLLALDHWSSALQIARKINDRELCIRVYLGIGQVYIGFGDYHSALKFNELALEMARRINHDERRCEALLNIASDAFRLQRYSYTMQCIDEAEKLLEATITNKIWSAEVVYYRGLVHGAQHHYAQARIELETAYELNVQNDNLWGKSHALTALGEVLFKMGDASAEQVLLKALQLARQGSQAALERRCNQALLGWYLQQGNLSATLPYYSDLLHDQQQASSKMSVAQLRQIQQLMSRSQIRLVGSQLGL